MLYFMIQISRLQRHEEVLPSVRIVTYAIKLFSGCAGGEEAEEDGHHRSLGPLRQTQTIRLKGKTGLFKFSDILRERF